MIDTWFPTAVMRLENLMSEKENEAIYHYLKCLKDTNKTSNNNGWLSDVQTSFGIHDCSGDNVLWPLHEKVTETVNEFSKLFLAELKMKCNQSWFNYYGKNDYQEYHIHPNNHFSAVYFVKCDEGSSPFILKNPKTNMYPFTHKNFNSLNFDIVEYEPTNNSLLVFESCIRHMVPKNKTEERITMSFNYSEEKE